VNHHFLLALAGIVAGAIAALVVAVAGPFSGTLPIYLFRNRSVLETQAWREALVALACQREVSVDDVDSENTRLRKQLGQS